MNSTGPPSNLEQQLREMNETLLVSSVKQHELAEQAQKAEAALAAINVQLATELAATQRLHEMLADLDHRKDEFLAMLSHELRNPLAPILNAALLLRLHSNRNRQLGIENPILQQSATIIERQVGQLARIVDELLEVSRITTCRIQLHQERIAVDVVVKNALATVRALIDQHKHELTVSLSPQPIWLHADAARLEQVVVNLLTNAAKHTDEGGHIWLTVQQEGEEAVTPGTASRRRGRVTVRREYRSFRNRSFAAEWSRGEIDRHRRKSLGCPGAPARAASPRHTCGRGPVALPSRDTLGTVRTGAGGAWSAGDRPVSAQSAS